MRCLLDVRVSRALEMNTKYLHNCCFATMMEFSNESVRRYDDKDAMRTQKNSKTTLHIHPDSRCFDQSKYSSVFAFHVYRHLIAAVFAVCDLFSIRVSAAGCAHTDTVCCLLCTFSFEYGFQLEFMPGFD